MIESVRASERAMLAACGCVIVSMWKCSWCSTVSVITAVWPLLVFSVRLTVRTRLALDDVAAVRARAVEPILEADCGWVVLRVRAMLWLTLADWLCVAESVRLNPVTRRMAMNCGWATFRVRDSATTREIVCPWPVVARVLARLAAFDAT